MKPYTLKPRKQPGLPKSRGHRRCSICGEGRPVRHVKSKSSTRIAARRALQKVEP